MEAMRRGEIRTRDEYVSRMPRVFFRDAWRSRFSESSPPTANGSSGNGTRAFHLRRQGFLLSNFSIELAVYGNENDAKILRTEKFFSLSLFLSENSLLNALVNSLTAKHGTGSTAKPFV